MLLILDNLYETGFCGDASVAWREMCVAVKAMLGISQVLLWCDVRVVHPSHISFHQCFSFCTKAAGLEKTKCQLCCAAQTDKENAPNFIRH